MSSVQHPAISNMARSNDFISLINANTTVNEFENFLRSNPEYRVEDYYENNSVLIQAVKTQNTKLISHIATTYGAKTLNYGTKYEVTPLFYSTYLLALNQDCSKNYKTVKLLCRLGAKADLGVLYRVKHPKIGIILKNSTALWITLEPFFLP